MCHTYCLGENPGWKMTRFQLPLNKTFCPTRPTLIHWRFKHRKKKKKKSNAFCLSLIGFPHKVHISVLKASKYSILMGIELKPLVSESLIDSQNIMLHWFWTNWLPIGFNLALITTTLCSTTNGESLKVLYTHPWSLAITLETFTSLKLCKCYQIPHPSLRVASNPNKTKTNYHWLNHLTTLHTHYITPPRSR